MVSFPSPDRDKKNIFIHCEEKKKKPFVNIRTDHPTDLVAKELGDK